MVAQRRSLRGLDDSSDSASLRGEPAMNRTRLSMRAYIVALFERARRGDSEALSDLAKLALLFESAAAKS